MISLKIGTITLIAKYVTNDRTRFDQNRIPIKNYVTVLQCSTDLFVKDIAYGTPEYGNGINYVDELRRLQNLILAAEQFCDR